MLFFNTVYIQYCFRFRYMHFLIDQNNAKEWNNWSISISTIVYFWLETEMKEMEILLRNCGGKVTASLHKVELCFFAYLQSVNWTV